MNALKALAAICVSSCAAPTGFVEPIKTYFYAACTSQVPYTTCACYESYAVEELGVANFSNDDKAMWAKVGSSVRSHETECLNKGRDAFKAGLTAGAQQ